jgi:hypothetical protein
MSSIPNYAVMKMIRLSIGYMSINITNNYMSQLYTESVLVNNSDPPNLINYVWLLLAIDIIFNSLILAILWGLGSPIIKGYDIQVYIYEYIIGAVLLTTILLCISTTMYSKKFFLYKDDGLRSIRALTNIAYKFVIIINIIPFLWPVRDTQWFQKLILDSGTIIAKGEKGDNKGDNKVYVPPVIAQPGNQGNKGNKGFNFAYSR